MSTVIRRFACAEGRVQGVGFRMFVRQQAAFDAMRAGNMFIRVDHLTVEERALLEGERSFDVRY